MQKCLDCKTETNRLFDINGEPSATGICALCFYSDRWRVAIEHAKKKLRAKKRKKGQIVQGELFKP